MSCSGYGPCSCAPGCVKPAAVANAQGFRNAPGCCAAPCPAFPLHKLNICLSVARGTLVEFTRGCGGTTCDDINWGWSEFQSSNGDTCATINISYTDIQNGSFVRLKLCPENPCNPCDPQYTCSGALVYNTLTKFQVDGVDYKTTLQAIANSEDQDTFCYKVRCADGGCCDPLVFVNLDRMKLGTEIVFGPIGTSLPPV
jgi:hypothetical protein